MVSLRLGQCLNVKLSFKVRAREPLPQYLTSGSSFHYKPRRDNGPRPKSPFAHSKSQRVRPWRWNLAIFVDWSRNNAIKATQQKKRPDRISHYSHRHMSMVLGLWAQTQSWSPAAAGGEYSGPQMAPAPLKNARFRLPELYGESDASSSALRI